MTQMWGLHMQQRFDLLLLFILLTCLPAWISTTSHVTEFRTAWNSLMMMDHLLITISCVMPILFQASVQRGDVCVLEISDHHVIKNIIFYCDWFIYSEHTKSSSKAIRCMFLTGSLVRSAACGCLGCSCTSLIMCYCPFVVEWKEMCISL